MGRKVVPRFWWQRAGRQQRRPTNKRPIRYKPSETEAPCSDGSQPLNPLFRGAAAQNFTTHNMLSRSGRSLQFRREFHSLASTFQIAKPSHATALEEELKNHKSKLEENYDIYRPIPHQSLSPHLLREAKLETLHTRRKLNETLYRRVLYEVQAAAALSPPAPPEQGPTGTWWYQFEMDESTGLRRYFRFWQDPDAYSSNQQGGPPVQQSVLKVHPHDQLLSVSLAVDESCVACLVENMTDGRREVRLKHMDSDRESTFELGPDLVGLEWGPMSSEGDHALYLLKTDELGRPNRVLVSTVQPTFLDVSEAELLLQSNDPAEMVDVQRTKGCEYVIIQATTKTSNEIYLSSSPTSLAVILPRQKNLQYHVDVGEREDTVILLSKDGGEFCLFETSVSALPLSSSDIEPTLDWSESTPPSRAITDMDLFRDSLLLYENDVSTGMQQLDIRQHGISDASHSITIPLATPESPSIKVSPLGNSHFGSTSLRFLTETPVTPPTVHSLDLATGDVAVVKDGGITSIDVEAPPTSPYHQERITVPSLDGTEVPLSLFYKQSSESSSWSLWSGEHKASPRPVVVVSYGAYGEPVNLSYDPTLRPLIERDYIVAFAHTRGGGELGKAWYHAGRQENKLRAIEDLEACAEHLKDRFQGHVAAKGYSAAGVLIGAVMHRRPELFDSVLLTNAFVDVHETLTNKDLYLTAHEWDEYGNPLVDPSIDEVLRSYCPIANLAALDPDQKLNFPRTLIIGSMDDTQVPAPSNAMLFAQLLKGHHVEPENVWLHLEESGGHDLSGHRPSIAALEISFLLQERQEEEHRKKTEFKRGDSRRLLQDFRTQTEGLN